VALALFSVRLGTTSVALPVTVSVMFVPDGVPDPTCNTSVKLAVAFTAMAALSLQVIVPVPPTAGTVPHVQFPPGPVIDTNVVFGGVTSVKVAPVAVAGPRFFSVCVYVTLLPAATDVGAATLVATRSACAAVATTSAAVAELFAEFGSAVAELTVAVSLIAVPAGVPAVTFKTYEIVAVPAARLVSVHVKVPTVQVHPAGPVRETAVVFAGKVSVNETLAALLGPPLVTTCVYVMLFPACTGTGAGVFVTDKAAEVPTNVVTVALLLPLSGSLVVELTVAVCVKVEPEVAVAGTVTVNVNAVVVVFVARFPVSVQVSVPSTHVHPPGPVSETAVVPVGSVSTTFGVVAADVPAFVTVCV
jgi:hypothetical protein